MRASQMNMELSARPVWVWIALTLQFLILLSVAPNLSVLTSGSFYTFNGANSLSIAIFMLVPAATIGASLVGLWRFREWGWMMAVFVDGLYCALTLLGFSEFGVSTVWKFAGFVALFLRPVRTHFLGQKEFQGLAVPLQGISDGASYFARLVSAPVLIWSSRIIPWKKVVVIFCLAGFLSAGVFVSYYAWINSLSEANEARYQRESASTYLGAASTDESMRAAENARISKYADRILPILFLGFPSAITLALLIGIGARWLPGTLVPQMLPALILAYLASCLAWLIFISFAMSLGYLWYLGAIPALIVAAFLISCSATIFTSRSPWKLFAAVLISAVVCGYLWVIISGVLGPRATHLHPASYMLIALETIWAGMYGWTLTKPEVLSKAGPPTIARPTRKPV
jgi:hypothetical protein